MVEGDGSKDELEGFQSQQYEILDQMLLCFGVILCIIGWCQNIGNQGRPDISKEVGVELIRKLVNQKTPDGRDQRQ